MKSKHISYSVTLFSANRVVYEIMWKNMVCPDSPEVTTSYGACAFHDG